MSEQPNAHIANSFQTPNMLVDELLCYLTGEEAKCLWYATREILGWQNSQDNTGKAISLSQFEKHTGLSRPAVSKAINQLTKLNILLKVGQATQRGQQWVLNFADPDTIDWETLKQRQEANRKKGRKRTQAANQKRSEKHTQSEAGTSHIPPQGSTSHVPGWYAPRTAGGTSDVHNETHKQTQQIKPSMTKTSDDVFVEDTNPREASRPRADIHVDNIRPPVHHNPERYTVREITRARLTRQQWQVLGENEQAHKARKTVLAHCRAKLKKHPLAPRRVEMLAAMNRATAQDYADPGMAAAFQQVLGKLWPAENYYTPEELNHFAADCGPVTNVYWLPGELSTWRNQNKIKKGQHSNGTGKQQVNIPGARRDYNRDGLAEFRREWDERQGETVPLPHV